MIIINWTHRTSDKKSPHTYINFFFSQKLAQLSSSTRAHMKNKRMIIIITCSSSLLCLHSSLLSLFFPSIYLKNIFLFFTSLPKQQEKKEYCTHNIKLLTHTHSTNTHVISTIQKHISYRNTFYIKPFACLYASLHSTHSVHVNFRSCSLENTFSSSFVLPSLVSCFPTTTTAICDHQHHHHHHHYHHHIL